MSITAKRKKTESKHLANGRRPLANPERKVQSQERAVTLGSPKGQMRLSLLFVTNRPGGGWGAKGGENSYQVVNFTPASCWPPGNQPPPARVRERTVPR